MSEELKEKQGLVSPDSPSPSVALYGGKYEIVSCLGRGGMSVVYKARDLSLQRIVAIKQLDSDRCRNTNGYLRLQQKACAQLDHPNIVKVYDFAIPDDGAPYLVIDYVEGRSLAEIIHEKGLLSFREAAPIFLQIADGLTHAHKNGIVHRDLKPSNVIISEFADGKMTAKIVDFGIAQLELLDGIDQVKLTQTGETIGSPQYMSPEQCLGKKLDQRSDLYSLGCLMYEVLCGHAPFVSDSQLGTISKHILEEAEPLTKVAPDTVPSVVWQIVSVLLAKNPEERYQTSDELRRDLDSAARGKKLETRFRWTKREKLFSRVLATLVGVLILLVGVFSFVEMQNQQTFRLLNAESKATALQDAGDFKGAESVLLGALNDCRYDREQLEVYSMLATSAHQQAHVPQHLERELGYREKVLQLLQKTGENNSPYACVKYWESAYCAALLNRNSASAQYAQSGLNACRNGGAPDSKIAADLYCLLAKAQAAENNNDEAKQSLLHALNIRSKLGDPIETASCERFLGKLCALQKNYTESYQHYDEAISVLEHGKGVDFPPLAIILTNYAEALREKNGNGDAKAANLERRAHQIAQSAKLAGTDSTLYQPGVENDAAGDYSSTH